MKQIPILSGKAMIVELPEGATNLKVLTVHQGSKSFPSLKYDRPDLVRGFIDLPPGNWRIIGMLPEVTEEQVSELVDGCYPTNTLFKYKDYKVDSYVLDTATESLESAIVAEGYYLDDNPMGGKPEMVAATDDDFDDFDFPNERGQRKWEEWEDDYNKWNEAQSRVLDRSRCLLLGRVY